MSLENILKTRSQSQCELCTNPTNLSVYTLPPDHKQTAEQAVLLCETCLSLITGSAPANDNHWRCLSESMWSEHAAVQVMAYRLLKQLSQLDWAQNLLGQLYLDEATQQWADATDKNSDKDTTTKPTKDSNGAILMDGDSVTLIKDLDVKGANFTAKRGTIVKNISLTANPEHIEGRVNGTEIVLLTCFLKKAN